MPPRARKRQPSREEESEFDLFWATHTGEQGPRTERILRVDVTVPTDVPLSLVDRVEELRTQDNKEAFQELLTILLGEGTVEAWKANGITIRQYQLLTTWAILNATRRPTSFEEAAVELAAAGQAAGKAPATVIEGTVVPNRTDRRRKTAASSRTRVSAKVGISSSPTSAANIGSPKRS